MGLSLYMKHDEYKLQCNFVEYLRLNKIFVFSIVNEGKKNIITASIHKHQGLLAGSRDLQILHKGKVYFIEMKSEKGRQSESQKEFQRVVEEQGHFYQVIRTWEECEKFVQSLKS